MDRLAGIIIVSLIGLMSAASANELSDMVGNWRTVRHGAEVMIVDCGDGSPCGVLVSISSDVSRGHTNDVRNPNLELRKRSLKGLPIIWGYSRKGNGWKRGRVYNPETGQTFRSSLDLISSDRLRVKGCMGPFCRAQTWVRISEPKTNKTESDKHE